MEIVLVPTDENAGGARAADRQTVQQCMSEEGRPATCVLACGRRMMDGNRQDHLPALAIGMVKKKKTEDSSPQLEKHDKRVSRRDKRPRPATLRRHGLYPVLLSSPLRQHGSINSWFQWKAFMPLSLLGTPSVSEKTQIIGINLDTWSLILFGMKGISTTPDLIGMWHILVFLIWTDHVTYF